MSDLKKNLANFFKMNMNSFLLVEDTRFKASRGTAKYQIGIQINNQKEFNKVFKKLENLMKKKHFCRKGKDGMNCKVNNDWKEFGQREGVYNILYPQKFKGSNVYVINHGVQERLMLEPSIMKKNLLHPMINDMGRKYGVKLTKKKANNKKLSKTQICNKYKDKSVKKTPKNWAYNKCMRQPKRFYGNL